MAKQTINLGTAPTGAGGDTNRSAFVKAQANFDEIYGSFYQRSNIVGTVTQTSGVVTGAVIETGSNTNGRYTRFADGTMICQSTGVLSAQIPANAQGDGVPSGKVSINFPASFLDSKYTFYASAYPLGSWDHFGCISSNASSAKVATAFIRNGATAQTFTISYIAVGRWY